MEGAELERLREHHTVALRIREQRERQRQREAEMSALYETASDLTAIRDVDAILAAIVRRARSLLHADMTYLSLNDEEEGASYMKVTDGALTAEFRRLRLPLGTGLLGLVAQTGEPYYTEDYQSDERFLHREFIDSAVDGEKIRAILGVPLTVEGKVIGALLAVHRNVRPFPPGEVSLLMSFAAHAAVALENARLFERIDSANRQVRAQADAVEVAAHAHDRLTDVLLHGGGVADVADVVADVLHGHVLVVDSEGHRLAGAGDDDLLDGLDDAVAEARASGRSVRVRRSVVRRRGAGRHRAPRHAAAARAGRRARATPTGAPSSAGALVTALVLLFNRSVAEAEERVRGELLSDLLEHRDHDESRLLRAGASSARRPGRSDRGRGGPRSRASSGTGRRRSRPGSAASCRAWPASTTAWSSWWRRPPTSPSRRAGRCTSGCSRPAAPARSGSRSVAGGPGDVATAYAEARGCLDTLVTLGRLG